MATQGRPLVGYFTLAVARPAGLHKADTRLDCRRYVRAKVVGALHLHEVAASLSLTRLYLLARSQRVAGSGLGCAAANDFLLMFAHISETCAAQCAGPRLDILEGLGIYHATSRSFTRWVDLPPRLQILFCVAPRATSTASDRTLVDVLIGAKLQAEFGVLCVDKTGPLSLETHCPSTLRFSHQLHSARAPSCAACRGCRQRRMALWMSPCCARAHSLACWAPSGRASQTPTESL